MTSALTCSSHLCVQLFYLSVWLHPRRPDTLLLLWSATSCLLTSVPPHVLKRWQNLCESSNFAFVFLFVFLFVCCMCAVTPPTSGPRLYSDSFLDLSSKPPPPVFSLDLSSSVWAPCPLSPSHRIGCYSGLDLVLVGGAGILMAGMATPLISLPDTVCLECSVTWRHCTASPERVSIHLYDIILMTLQTYLVLTGVHHRHCPHN